MWLEFSFGANYDYFLFSFDGLNKKEWIGLYEVATQNWSQIIFKEYIFFLNIYANMFILLN